MIPADDAELETLRATIHRLEQLVNEARHVLETTAVILLGVKTAFCRYPMLVPPNLSEKTHDED